MWSNYCELNGKGKLFVSEFISFSKDFIFIGNIQFSTLLNDIQDWSMQGAVHRRRPCFFENSSVRKFVWRKKIVCTVRNVLKKNNSAIYKNRTSVFKRFGQLEQIVFSSFKISDRGRWRVYSPKHFLTHFKIPLPFQVSQL